MLISGRERMPLLAALMVLFAMLAGVGTAAAAPGDRLPTAPLSDVQPGQTCQARTVLKGTAIESFDVEILDVVDKTGVGYGSLIYFKVTDPDLVDVGVAQGMSGSPILCPIGGEDKVVGAISYGFAATGPKGFATPIGDMLSGQPGPGASTMKSKSGPTYRGHELVELTSPLTVTGVPAAAQKAFKGLLEKQGFDSVVFATPAAIDVPADSPDLAPGGAFSLNYSFGDVTVGAICTISYRDGNDFWGCGHPLDLAGERALSISGAYIYDVMGDSWSTSVPFKFGAPTETQVGAALYDGPFAVSGRLGQAVRSIPIHLKLTADGRTVTGDSRVVDEDSLKGGSPVGFSLVAPVASMMVSQAQVSGAGMPYLQSGRVCAKQKIIGFAGKTINSCNRFAATGDRAMEQALGVPIGAASAAASKTSTLDSLLKLVTYKYLRPGALDLNIKVDTGQGLRKLVSMKPVGSIRKGQKARLQVISADRSGKRYRQVLRVPVPRKARGGSRRSSFSVESGAYSSSWLFDGFDITTDNDSSPFMRYLDPIFGGVPISSQAQLNKAIKALFNDKAKLELSVPWQRKSIAFPLTGGSDLLVGDVRFRAPVLPARGGRPTSPSVR